MLARLRRPCAAVLLLAAVGSASAAAPSNAGVGTGPAPEWTAGLPATPDAKDPRPGNSPLDHLAHDTQVLVKGPATERYEYNAYRINQPAALKDAGTVSIPFSASFQKVTVHFLRIKRDAAVIDLTDSAEFRVVSRENGFNAGILVGHGTAVAQVADLRVGDIVEYAYTTKGNNPVFGEQAAFTLAWNGILPLALRRLRIVEPPGGLGLRVMSPRGAEALDLRRIEKASGRETIIEGRDVPGARLEPNMPAGIDPLIIVAVTPFGSWQDVRRWAEGLFRAEAQPSAAYLALLARLRQMPSKRGAIEEAVRFVQDDIRYFSMSIGENSHRPYAPSEVVARRYGDCKDKSLLLTSLLRALGVEARPAMVSIARKAGIARFPPMPNVFDHVVTNFRFDGKDYWIDPTRGSGGLAFDKQGIAFAASKALRIDGGDTGLADIPEGNPTGIEIVETAEVRSIDAPVLFRIETRLSGFPAQAQREAHARRGKEANERAYLEAFSRRYADVKAAAPLQVRENGDGTLAVVESYEIGQFFRNEGLDKKLAPLGAQQLLLWLGITGQRERIYPFAIPGGRGTFRYQAAISFPAGIVGREDPLSNLVTDPHFRLATTRSFRGTTMRVSAELEILRSEVPPADFAAYVDKMKKARAALLDFVLLTSENLSSGPAQKPRRVGDRMREENQALAHGLTKAIDSGKLGDADAAEAYFKRAITRMALRDDKGAMDDLNASMRLRPFFGQAFSDRALLHMRGGRMSAAEEDLTKAITLGAQASSAYLRRGHVRFLAGRYGEALADFQQAERANAVGIHRDFITIWQALALRALGHDPKPAFQAVAAADHRRWPVPILTMILGDATVDDMLRLAESNSADERDANLCEAHFFAGQRQLLAGDREAAAASFRAALATGIDWFMEYDLAKAALARLTEYPTH